MNIFYNPQVRIGIQTASWGPGPVDIEEMLKGIKGAGYEGVEFMQDPTILGLAKDLFAMLGRLELAFLGVAGGSFEERLAYVHEMKSLMAMESHGFGWGMRLYEAMKSSRVPYVYVDDWRDEFHRPFLQEAETIIALHPHMFKPIQTAREANAVLHKYSALQVLPDTAHLVVAGENPVTFIETHFHRLAAVHLKDWSADFGRSYQFYAMGFTELGQGVVLLKEVMKVLLARKYAGWIVVEQDSSPDPLASARKSRLWLREQFQI